MPFSPVAALARLSRHAGRCGSRSLQLQPENAAQIRPAYVGAIRAGFGTAPSAPENPPEPWTVLEFLWPDMLRPDAHAGRAALASAARKEAMAFDSRARLKEIKCPTFIVAGSDDNAVPMHHAKMLHDGIARSKLVVIKGANHALLWAHPGQLLRAVDDFLGV
jgi:pimeloyl-ACP methyl ester carboxylesterase